MNLRSWLLYSHWIKMPDIVYLVLFVGGWILLAVSAGRLMAGAFRKKEKSFFKNWWITLAVCILIIVLTSTGKIAPQMAFGG